MTVAMNQFIEICLAMAACCSLALVSAHPTTSIAYDQAGECLEEQSPMQLGYNGGAQIFGGMQTLAAKSIAEPIHPSSAAAASIFKFDASEPILNSAATPPLKYDASEPILSSAAAPIIRYTGEPTIDSAAAAAAAAAIHSDGTAAATISGGGESVLRTYDHRPSAAVSKSLLKISDADSNYAIGARTALRTSYAANSYALPSASSYQTINRKWTDSKNAAEAQFNAASSLQGQSLRSSIAAAQLDQLQHYTSTQHGFAGAAAQPMYAQSLKYGYAGAAGAQPQYQSSYGYAGAAAKPLYAQSLKYGYAGAAAAQPEYHSMKYESAAGAAAAQPQYQSSYGFAGVQPQYQPWGQNALGPIAYAPEEELCEE